MSAQKEIPPVDGKADVNAFIEFAYAINKDDPNYSLCRATENRGQDAHTDNMFGLNAKAQKDIVKVFLATREEMENKRINEVFGKDFLESNFWLYWRTMFAFEEWHSALEMKLYLHRFIHHIGSLAVDAAPLDRQADREVPVFDRRQHAQQLARVNLTLAIGLEGEGALFVPRGLGPTPLWPPACRLLRPRGNGGFSGRCSG